MISGLLTGGMGVWGLVGRGGDGIFLEGGGGDGDRVSNVGFFEHF